MDGLGIPGMFMENVSATGYGPGKIAGTVIMQTFGKDLGRICLTDFI
jgi:hypothetical protein